MQDGCQFKTIVIGGGFLEEEKAESTNSAIDTSVLFAKHEEADTRMILHCIHTNSEAIVV